MRYRKIALILLLVIAIPFESFEGFSQVQQAAKLFRWVKPVRRLPVGLQAAGISLLGPVTTKGVRDSSRLEMALSKEAVASSYSIGSQIAPSIGGQRAPLPHESVNGTLPLNDIPYPGIKEPIIKDWSRQAINARARLIAYPLGTSRPDVITIPISKARLLDSNNGGFLHRKPAREILGKIPQRHQKTIIMQPEDPLNKSAVINILDDTDFAVTMVSDPQKFLLNMETIRVRKPSHRIAIFDFAPRTKSSLEAMDLSTNQLTGWKKNTEIISNLAKKYQNYGITQPVPSMDGLFSELRNNDGAVVIIYGHSDGEKIWIDTPKGVEVLSHDSILNKLVRPGNHNLLPPVILLNCEAGPVLGPTFLEAGSPLVFASDTKIPINSIPKFLKNVFESVKNNNDALDAIYDGVVKKGPPGLSPISTLLFSIEKSQFRSLINVRPQKSPVV